MKEWSIARRLFAGHLLFMLVLTAVLSTAVVLDSRDRLNQQAAERMTAVATTVANSPSVLAAVQGPDPSAVLQPYAAKVMTDAPADFVTIMAPDRTRWTHPNPEEIGKPYIGTVAPALEGRTFTETTAGTLGPSIRTIVPVKDSTGTVRAMVAAGVTVTTVDVALNARLPAVAGIAVALLLGGLLAAWLLGRYLRRVTLGRGPEELGRLFAYYEAALHSARDGLLLVDGGKVRIYNDRAAELLGLPSPPPETAQTVAELGIPDGVAQLLSSGRPARDELFVAGRRVVVLSQEPTASPSAARGKTNARKAAVVTVADHTELLALGDELQTSRTLATALRSQTHEHANRIHTLVSLMEMGRTEDALDFATADLALSQQLADEAVAAVGEPVLSALLMGKSAQAHERGITLKASAAGARLPAALPAHDLVTILGNLIDNALDAAAGSDGAKWVHVDVQPRSGGGLAISVTDSGPGTGTAALDQLAELGYSTKAVPPVQAVQALPDGGSGGGSGTGADAVTGAGTSRGSGAGRGIGLALVRQTVARLGGTLDVVQPTADGSGDGTGAGTLFTVLLPATDTATDTATAHQTAEEAAEEAGPL